MSAWRELADRIGRLRKKRPRGWADRWAISAMSPDGDWKFQGYLYGKARNLPEIPRRIDIGAFQKVRIVTFELGQASDVVVVSFNRSEVWKDDVH